MLSTIVIKEIPCKYKEVVSLDEAKSYLKIDFSEHDHLLKTIIQSVREYAEKFLSIHLVQKEFLQKNFGQNLREVYLAHFPVSTLVNVSIIDDSKNFILLGDDEYTFDGKKIVSIQALSRIYRGVVISYKIGFEDLDIIPASIKMGMLIHIASIYDKGELGEAMPRASINLYKPYRKIRL